MKIAVIGAMEEEVELLREKMDVHKAEVIAHCEYFIGTLQGKEVVLSKSGIGKVNAAMATAILFERYNPDVVVNTGSAGGYNSELKIGDLVISSEVCHHDVDVTAFGYKYGQVPQLPEAFKADASMIEIAEAAARSIEGVQAVKGLIATGDTFMSDPDKVEFVRGKFPDIQAVEMEGAAIAQVAYQFDIPFVIIRSLSDIAGQKSEISFDKFIEKASVNSANLVMEMIKGLEK
ncbi:MAG TPA: 5'-methylthioadenosine/S-adenosylhomocysteine nucleosidase [Bacillus bacterium]|uniref:5'-methylthioadenosine/S-adenosylhomocysteine nucleosidase n=1 Tax=Siminovitchia fordii TaxID=254759 RepID=A0ABQ4K4G6_9BACI|nr:5'-methylthioadenosine/S-adenosylhomocysteine nucleosidase [Siminovitchia fordii]GIN20085.1 5'-methylthioadenosine/S-adenosylhomocysteine nucleosidase [Siminovitchia fordii]HBZ09164.1 5'-methylthioadenosine/S-adenosylhomocysteine nucleosidase [Bacillus sp. (in: firmicutes)]